MSYRPYFVASPLSAIYHLPPEVDGRKTTHNQTFAVLITAAKLPVGFQASAGKA